MITPFTADEVLAVHIEDRAARWEHRCPTQFQQITLDDLETTVANKLRHWSANLDTGTTLLVCGPYGTGKSQAVWAILRELHLGQAIDFEWVRTPELLGAIRGDFSGGRAGHELVYRFVHAPVAVLDDLGAERLSEFSQGELDSLIDQRWRERRPTVITTNVDRATLTAGVGPRAMSRLLGSADVILMDGPDRRNLNSQEQS